MSLFHFRTYLVFNSYGRPSSLRKPHDSLADPKYAGRKITRALGEAPESSEKGDEGDEPLEHESHGSSSSEASEQEDRNMKEQETGESSEEEEERSTAKAKTVEEEKNATDDVSSSLKRMRDADRLKGQAVTSQIVSVLFSNSSIALRSPK